MLATAFSNVAVDQIMAGLIELGVKCVRVGSSSKVAEELRAKTVEVLKEQHPATSEIKQELEVIRLLSTGAPDFNSKKMISKGWKKIRYPMFS